jgi:hypothetical protein
MIQISANTMYDICDSLLQNDMFMSLQLDLYNLPLKILVAGSLVIDRLKLWPPGVILYDISLDVRVSLVKNPTHMLF